MILSVLIFLLVGLVYIYILHQWKYNDNLEVFELDYLDSPTQLQSACDLRQPLILPSFLEPLPPLPKHAGVLTLSVKDTRCYKDRAAGPLDAVVMTLDGAQQFLDAGSAHDYFCEGNADFLRDSGLLRQVKDDVDAWLKPPTFTVHSEYDFLMGNASWTPLRYHTNNRRFLCVLTGVLRVRFAPWKAIPKSQMVKDYEFYEFYTQTDAPSLSSSLTMDVVVQEGQILYVPPYWWYALDFSASRGSTFVIQCSYMTAMNAVAHAHDLLLYALQRQNIKTHIIKERCDELNHQSPPKDNPTGSSPSGSPAPNNVLAQESVQEDVHREDPVEHGEIGQSVSLEHKVVQ
jgi:hypothetical protein